MTNIRAPFPNQHQYAVDQEIMRHNDAVIAFGELNACILYWNVRDFTKGLVTRCSTCYTAYGQIAEAYGQPAFEKCPACYGTSFQGGVRAIVFRPVLWQQNISQEGDSRRGMITASDSTVQTTSDFTMRDNDTLVRPDGSRWRITAPQYSNISTGYGPGGANFDGATFRTNLEDPTSVVYIVPITWPTRDTTGWLPYNPLPTSADLVFGPLVVDDTAP